MVGDGPSQCALWQEAQGFGHSSTTDPPKLIRSTPFTLPRVFLITQVTLEPAIAWHRINTASRFCSSLFAAKRLSSPETEIIKLHESSLEAEIAGGLGCPHALFCCNVILSIGRSYGSIAFIALLSLHTENGIRQMIEVQDSSSIRSETYAAHIEVRGASCNLR